MVELVDTHALGACAARREGSSPFIRTKVKDQPMAGLLLWCEVNLNLHPGVKVRSAGGASQGNFPMRTVFAIVKFRGRRR